MSFAYASLVDGDGKCDYLITDKIGGSVEVILNGYTPGTGFSWNNIGYISLGVGCEEQYGFGLFDMAIRFADLDGMFSCFGT